MPGRVAGREGAALGAALAGLGPLAVALVAASAPETVPVWPAALAAGLVTLWIAGQDLADHTIPDAALVALAALGAGVRLAEGSLVGESLADTFLGVAVDAAICGGLLLALREGYYRRRGVDGLGFGDVKLAAAGGILAETSGFAWALFGASLAGIAVALACQHLPMRGVRPGMADRLPFGALLAPALWVAWMVERSTGAAALGW